MDPIANLQEQLGIADQLIDIDPDSMSHQEMQSAIDNGVRLAELVRSLDEWITNGGFLPPRWKVQG